MFPRNNPQKQRPILAFGDWIVNVYFQIFSSLFHKNTKGWPDLRLANLVDVSPALWSLWSEARLQGSMAEMQELRSSAEEFKQRRSELGHFFLLRGDRIPMRKAFDCCVSGCFLAGCTVRRFIGIVFICWSSELPYVRLILFGHWSFRNSRRPIMWTQIMDTHMIPMRSQTQTFF